MLKYILAGIFAATASAQVTQVSLCIQPYGTAAAVKIIQCPNINGVALSTLPANSLAVELPNGSYLPVIVANPTPGTTTAAASTIVPFLDPVGNSYSIPVLAFTMVEGFAILQHTAANPVLVPVAFNTPFAMTDPPIVTCVLKPSSLLDDACTFIQ